VRCVFFATLNAQPSTLHPDLSDPADLAQEFLFDHALEKQIVQKADATKGRFRDFLWKCLDHFWIDKLRHVKPTTPIEGIEDFFQDEPKSQPGTAFDLAVAKGLANRVLGQLERQHRESERSTFSRPCGRTFCSGRAASRRSWPQDLARPSRP
jgi:hypothetical protein